MTVENLEMPLLAKFQQRGHKRLGVQCDIIYRTWSTSPFVPHHGWTCHSQWDLTDLGTVTVQWLWLPHWLILGLIVLLSTTFLEREAVTWELPVRIQPLQVLVSAGQWMAPSLLCPEQRRLTGPPYGIRSCPAANCLHIFIHSFTHSPHLLWMRTTCQACSPGLGMQTLDPGRFPDAILETESPQFLTLEVYNTSVIIAAFAAKWGSDHHLCLLSFSLHLQYIIMTDCTLP